MNIIQTNFQYRNPLIPLDLNKVLFLIVHHIDAVKATPEQIHQWHLANGWLGIGYNEYIRKDGSVYICRGNNIGAQCENMNSKSYGIACEGNYSTETVMPAQQFESLIARLKFNKPRFKNLVEIAPHSKFFATSCPGKNFPLGKILNAVNNIPPEIAQDVYKLQSKGIKLDADYWIKNAVLGKTIKGEYAAALINRCANS